MTEQMPGGAEGRLERVVGHAVWWTSSEDCQQLGEGPDWPEDVPMYVRMQYDLRCGRNGRGRLWCAEGLPTRVDDGADGDWPDTDASRAAERCGGIVIELRHAVCVAPLPGFLTTMSMRWLSLRPNAQVNAPLAPGEKHGK